MEIYLVGGAVRDTLLGLPIKERDWVVVGATPDELLKQGYKPVGKDFPVFLHPQTGEEYALARTERKSGKGYKGFTVYTDPAVTLEEDLLRRDLTINAIAQTLDGRLIDPFQGQHDCEKKILRHVSDAFIEDPLRVLRVARFTARFHALGFRIAPETLALMQKISKSGELETLVPERVFREWERSLSEETPQQFLITLRDCFAFEALFPDVSSESLIANVELAAAVSSEPDFRFAGMLMNIDEKIITTLCARYKIPTRFTDLALLVSRHHQQINCNSSLIAEKILQLLKSTDAFRKPARFMQFLQIATLKHSANPQKTIAFFKKALEAAITIDNQPLLNQGLSGKTLGNAIDQKRIAAIAALKFD